MAGEVAQFAGAVDAGLVLITIYVTGRRRTGEALRNEIPLIVWFWTLDHAKELDCSTLTIRSLCIEHSQHFPGIRYEKFPI